MGNLVSGLGLSHGWTLRNRQSPPCCVAAATLNSPYSPRAVHPSERGAHVAIADRHQAAVSAWPSPISRVLPQRTYRNRQKAGPLSRTSR